MDTKNQIELTFEVIGTPSEQELNMIPREKYKMMAKGLPKRPGKELSKLFPNASNQAIDLLKKFLTFDASKRITVEEALRHPYLSALHYPDDEVNRNYNNLACVCSCEGHWFRIRGIQYDTLITERLEFHNIILDCIYEEILIYHFKDFKEEYERKKKMSESII